MIRIAALLVLVAITMAQATTSSGVCGFEAAEDLELASMEPTDLSADEEGYLDLGPHINVVIFSTFQKIKIVFCPVLSYAVTCGQSFEGTYCSAVSDHQILNLHGCWSQKVYRGGQFFNAGMYGGMALAQTIMHGLPQQLNFAVELNKHCHSSTHN